MSDEQHTHDHGMDHGSERPLAQIGDYSSGQGLVAIAGLAILALWVIFDVIMEEYFQPWALVVLAAWAVILPRVNRASVEKLHPLPTIMKALGYTIAIFGLIVIVDEVIDGVFDTDTGTLIGAILTYATFVMAYMGARKIDG